MIFFCQFFLFSPLYYSLSNSYLFYNKFAFSFSEKETKKLLSSWKEVRSSKVLEQLQSDAYQLHGVEADFAGNQKELITNKSKQLKPIKLFKKRSER